MNPTIEIIYGSRLHGLRLNRQMVQKQAADLCGFENQQIFSLLEHGKKFLQMKLLKQFVRALI